MASDAMTRTFQARLPGERPELEAAAAHLGAARRTLYARAKKAGVSFRSLKTAFRAEFGLPGRVFNALAIELAGIVCGIQEKAKADLVGLEFKIAETRKKLAGLRARRAKAADVHSKGTKKVRGQIHANERRLERLEAKRRRLEGLADNPYPPICFGSRKLFKAQHFLEENRYGGLNEWRADWQAARSGQFQIVGSEDEPSGNKTCRAVVEKDGAVTLSLALCGARNGDKLTIQGIRLPHGRQSWLDAIRAADAEAKAALLWQRGTAKLVAAAKAEGADEDIVKELRRHRAELRKEQPRQGAAISYRFLRDRYGWRILVTVEQKVAAVEPAWLNGAIGVDMNADHVAVAFVEANGGLAGVKRLPTAVCGKTSGRRRAIYGDVAAWLVRQALARGCPIVVEDLDFAAKKRRLADEGDARRARMLSSFACRGFRSALESAARRAGVALVVVDPAYTSVIGRALYAVPHGISSHLAAAFVIARRGIGHVESPRSSMRLPAGHGRPIVLAAPTCLRSKASGGAGSWAAVDKAFKAELAARPRPTGAERRRLRADATFLGGIAAPGGTPGEACRAAMAGGLPARERTRETGQTKFG